MTAPASSHREIVRSSSIVGGASLVNIGLSLLRMKAAALLAGSAGVGMIGLLQSLIAAGSTMAGLGLGSAATRQLAAERAARGAQGEADVRSTLFWAGLLLGALSFGVIAALREPLAARFLGDPSRSAEMPWLGAGVALTVVTAIQLGVLTGLRRIGDVARVNIASGVLATVLGIGALAIGGSNALLIFVVSAPLAGVLVGWWYVRRTPPVRPAISARTFARQGHQLLKVGSAVMIGGLITTGGQLAVRTIIGQELGWTALGHFHAAWTISMTYLGLVLQAMATDYYPRLSEKLGDQPALRRLVAEQTEVALLLAASVLLLMMGAAPLVLHLLYSSEFRQAADLLRWQVLGDLLKVAAWPLGFVLLAAGRNRAYVANEALAMGVFVGATTLLLPVLGLKAAGLAFVCMYAAYLCAAAVAVRRTLGSAAMSHPMLLLGTGGALLLVLASTLLGSVAALLTGTALSGASLLFALHRLQHALPAPLAAAAARLSALAIRR